MGTRVIASLIAVTAAGRAGLVGDTGGQERPDLAAQGAQLRRAPLRQTGADRGEIAPRQPLLGLRRGPQQVGRVPAGQCDCAVRQGKGGVLVLARCRRQGGFVRHEPLLLMVRVAFIREAHLQSAHG
ncbi:hypothetical protein ACH49_20825 [Streptomyces leeuwenhoekii]|uniref:Secreted protein n=1 Tax=Streptomyces leeuwenhoekii TaxID=1437453 RepID=A0ABR5HUW8_STRLW|nr:hypothetical protein ACH49_20825 [Streptomyces leeuwenhoekii]